MSIADKVKLIDDVITKEVELSEIGTTDDIQDAWIDLKDLINKSYQITQIKEPKHWIKINSANVGHEEMLDNFEEVLTNFNIDCYNDEELAQQHQCDLFIVLEKSKEEL